MLNKLSVPRSYIKVSYYYRIIDGFYFIYDILADLVQTIVSFSDSCRSYSSRVGQISRTSARWRCHSVLSTLSTSEGELSPSTVTLITLSTTVVPYANSLDLVLKSGERLCVVHIVSWSHVLCVSVPEPRGPVHYRDCCHSDGRDGVPGQQPSIQARLAVQGNTVPQIQLHPDPRPDRDTFQKMSGYKYDIFRQIYPICLPSVVLIIHSIWE